MFRPQDHSHHRDQDHSHQKKNIFRLRFLNQKKTKIFLFFKFFPMPLLSIDGSFSKSEKKNILFFSNFIFFRMSYLYELPVNISYIIYHQNSKTRPNFLFFINKFNAKVNCMVVHKKTT